MPVVSVSVKSGAAWPTFKGVFGGAGCAATVGAVGGELMAPLVVGPRGPYPGQTATELFVEVFLP